MTATLIGLVLLAYQGPPATAPKPSVVVVVGAGGTPEYEAQFRDWAGKWRSAAAKAGASFTAVGEGNTPGGPGDHDRLREVLAAEARGESPEPLWLVLIGHGTFDGRDAKFNLRGPDLADRELADWLRPMKRPLAVINCASSSGAFLSKLAGPGRVVVTATKSGQEQNYARFGGALASAVDDPRSDLDKDGQVSLLEAFLTAGARVGEFYKAEARLATEHPLIEDNGDGLGTPADWFQGVRATRRAKDGATTDGPRAHLLNLVPSARERELSPEARARRDRLELAVSALRDEKAKLPEDAYYQRLDALMTELGRVYLGPAAAPTAPTTPTP